MARPLSWAFAALLALGSPVASAAELCDATQQKPPQTSQPGKDDKGQTPQNRDGGHRPRWWTDPKLRADLGITDAQSTAVEAIWQKNVQSLRDARTKLEKLEEELTVLTNASTADEATVVAKIDAVENMRAEGNKRRTIVIYRMLKLLTPDQRVKVRAMFEQREPPKRFPALSR